MKYCIIRRGAYKLPGTPRIVWASVLCEREGIALVLGAGLGSFPRSFWLIDLKWTRTLLTCFRGASWLFLITMKIFISWSGKYSLGVATALREWLPYLFTGIDLFVSSEDIRKGKRWPLEVSKELDATNFGIVCLTPDKLEAPWLPFEAGALSKSLKEACVYTLLVGGLRIGDIEGPLSHFQHTVFEKEDFFKLVKSINEAYGQ